MIFFFFGKRIKKVTVHQYCQVGISNSVHSQNFQHKNLGWKSSEILLKFPPNSRSISKMALETVKAGGLECCLCHATYNCINNVSTVYSTHQKNHQVCPNSRPLKIWTSKLFLSIPKPIFMQSHMIFQHTCRGGGEEEESWKIQILNDQLFLQMQIYSLL